MLKAAELLAEFDEKKGFSNLFLRHRLKDGEWDKGLVVSIFYGVLRNSILLDVLIKRLSKRGKVRIKRVARMLLKVAMWLMLFARFKAVHVTNVAVSIVKGRWIWLTSFFNAVLRRASALNLEDLEKEFDDSVFYSIPQPFLDVLKSDAFFENNRDKILRQFNEEIPVFARKMKNSVDLAHTGALTEVFSGWYRVKFSRKVERGYSVEKIANSGYYITSLSTYIVERLFDRFLDDSSNVLDIAASPGGKSMIASEYVSHVFSNDNKFEKCFVLKRNFKNYGIDNAYIICSDAQKLPLKAKFDVVIADLPCTHAGFVRRHPEVKYKITRGLVNSAAASQLEMLKAASKLVKPSGVLFYIVCSMLREETIAVCSEFLRENADFIPVNFEKNLKFLKDPTEFALAEFGVNWVRVFPGGDWDGYFVAVFRRKRSA